MVDDVGLDWAVKPRIFKIVVKRKSKVVKR